MNSSCRENLKLNAHPLMLMLYSGPIQHSLCIFWLPYYKEVWVDKLTFTRVEMETEQRKIERQGDRSYAVAA